MSTIRNPYAKKAAPLATYQSAHPDSSSLPKKRTERPWENHRHAEALGRKSSADAEADHSQYTNNAVIASVDDSFDNGTIDWDKAVSMMDGAITTKENLQLSVTRKPVVKYRSSATDDRLASMSTHAACVFTGQVSNLTSVRMRHDTPSKITLEPRTMPPPGPTEATTTTYFPINSTASSTIDLMPPSPSSSSNKSIVAATLQPSGRLTPPRLQTQQHTSYTECASLETSKAPAPYAAAHIIASAAITTAAAAMPTRPPRSLAPAQHQTSIASLRPASWSIKQPPSSPASSVGSHTSLNYHPDPRQALLPRELQFRVESVEPVSDQYRADLVKHAYLSQPLNNGWTLFSHQKRAILAALLMRRKILALDMGLGKYSIRLRPRGKRFEFLLPLTPFVTSFTGKTLIGCCWARAFCNTFPDVKVIVLCPVSLKNEWKRTAEDAVGLTVQAEEISSRKKKDEDGNVVIASWAKIPDGIGQDGQKYVVIADEAHSMQNMTSTRTRDSLKLMLASNAIGVLLLTGTPMKNGKPANLFPLLKAVKHPFGNHQRAYEGHFCGGREIRFGNGGRPVWQATGAANLDQLRTLTQSHILHLTKDDCLKNLPPQTRVFKTVPVSSRSQMKHNQAMQNLAKIYENRRDANQEAILGAVQSLRMVDSLAKVDATVEVAKQVLDKEPAVVIFTGFLQVAKLVHQKLSEAGWKGELLTGETPAKKRQAMVDDFQNGISPVFVCTFGAGGVGLTLTAACTVILLDRPWTPGDAHQAEDRVRRIGQTKPVTSMWMSAFELDKQIDNMLESKSQTSSTVLSAKLTNEGSDDSSLANGNTHKLSIMKLLQSILLPANASSSHGLKQTTMLQYSQGSPRTK